MKNFNSKIKLGILLILFSYFNVGYSQYNPQMSVLSSNAVSFQTYDESTPNQYKVYTFTIPFYQNSFTGQLKFTKIGQFSCTGMGAEKRIRIYHQGTGYNQPSEITLPLNNIPIGTSYFTVEELCNTSGTNGNNGSSIVKKTRNVKLIIYKEQNPMVNLTFNRHCYSNINGYTGSVGLKVNGSYLNGNNLYLKVVSPPYSNCNNLASSTVSLSSLANNGSLNNSIFYNCSYSVGTYTVKLVHRYQPISNTITTPIEYIIPVTNSFGWTNYSFINGCPRNPTTKDPVMRNSLYSDFSNLKVSPNPVKDILSLQLENNEKIVSLRIYDYSGAQVKTQVSNIETVDLQDLKKGLYFIEIETENGIIREKIIKE